MIEWFAGHFGPYGPLILIVFVAWAVWAVKCSGPWGWTLATLLGFGAVYLAAPVWLAWIVAAFGIVGGYFLSCLRDPKTRCWWCKGETRRKDGRGNWHDCWVCRGKNRIRFGRWLIDTLTGNGDD